MKDEINKDFYCSARGKKKHGDIFLCPLNPNLKCGQYRKRYECGCLHRKWPTPEQYKEEYGEEPSLDHLVWVYIEEGFMGIPPGWQFGTYKWACDWRSKAPCVIACTPWGKPPSDWKPNKEEENENA